MLAITMHRRSIDEEKRIISYPLIVSPSVSADNFPFHVVIRLRFIIDFIAFPSQQRNKKCFSRRKKKGKEKLTQRR